MNLKTTLLLSLVHLLTIFSYAQSDSLSYRYHSGYDTLSKLLKDSTPYSFKKAVFITENIYLQNQMLYTNFDNHIQQLVTVIKAWLSVNRIQNYRYSDSTNIQKNFSIYKLLKDTVKLIDGAKTYFLLPYTYDFSDITGQKDWSNMFVAKLLSTKMGNCHSMPYLYKILADEIQATCWLALAPNHMYIENRCKKFGWYNTELTSGEFPIDAWIMESGYIPLQAIQHGIYMDTLSNQQSIALCVLDLAKGYEHQTKNYYDGFIIKCCDLSLQYFPLNVQAMLLKAETLKRVYQRQKINKNKEAKETYIQMEQLYIKLFDLGYREMPEKMYLQWLTSVTKERDKYSNKQVKETIKNITIH